MEATPLSPHVWEAFYVMVERARERKAKAAASRASAERAPDPPAGGAA